jgi:predicted acylesterase/phospholipase RssA
MTPERKVEALAEAGLHPDWVAGITIGAINCSLMAGNPPEKPKPQNPRRSVSEANPTVGAKQSTTFSNVSAD